MVDLSVDLISRVQELDVDALTRIYDQHNQGIYRYAMRMLGDEMLAEDCTAETFYRFLHAVQSRHGPREYLQAYLYRIAHNWITDHFRRNRGKDLSLSDNLSEGHEEMDLITHEKIQQQRVRGMLMRLTSDQRQVILLKYYEGWENAEIAAAINKPLGAVKALLHRAIKQLKKMIGNR